MDENAKTGFIGAGNMATALIKGLIHSGTYRKDKLLASDKEKGVLDAMASQFGITCTLSNRELVRDCSIIVLSVKPQNMRDVLEEMKGEIRNDHLIISIAAGIPLSVIRGVFEKVFTLGDSVHVYPGHGPSTTIGRERKTNPFFRLQQGI